MTAERWAPGTEISWRYEHGRGRLWEYGVRVIRDDPAGVVVWQPRGSQMLESVRLDGRNVRADKATMFTAETRVVETVWQDTSILRIAMPGKHWSVWVFFDGLTGEFRFWYGNVELPYRREPSALVSRDEVLDVVVAPDRSHTRKDEDELEIAVAQGIYTPAEVDRILAAAEEIEATVAVWGSPFCDGWEDFRPDPEWPLPRLPD